MQALNEKYMTDEETDSDDEDRTTLVKCSLPWRSAKCDRFLRTLDDRYAESREKKNNSKPLKPRKVGPDSERSPPQNAVAWAVLRSNGHSQSQNRQNVSPTTSITSFANPGRTTPNTSFANHSPTTPNTSFANPGAMANPDLSGASTPFSTSLASTPPNSEPTTPNSSFTNSGPSGVSTPFSSAPSLVSTLPNSAAGSTASVSPSDSSLQLNDDDDSDLEGWIRSVAGMS